MNTASPLIVHVVHRFMIGGMENGVVNLINGMDPHFRHAIICMDKSTDEFAQRLQRDDVSILALHKKPGRDPMHYLRLIRALRTLRPTLVHTRNIGTIEAGVIARMTGVKAVLHGEHGFDVNDLYGMQRRYGQLRRLANPFVRQFVCVSQQIRRWLEKDVRLPAEKLTQIYNGVDTQRFNVANREAARARLRELGVTGDFIAGSVGRLEAVKNPIELVKAFGQRCQTSSAFAQSASLVMLGGGTLRDQVDESVAQTGFAERINLLGSRNDVADLLPGFDAFVLPSLNEGISNTLLEAMASGVPVIASRVGGNAELFTDTQHGTLYESGDVDALASALGHYAANEPMRRDRAQAAREHVVGSFSLERMIERYQELYATYC